MRCELEFTKILTFPIKTLPGAMRKRKTEGKLDGDSSLPKKESGRDIDAIFSTASVGPKSIAAKPASNTSQASIINAHRREPAQKDLLGSIQGKIQAKRSASTKSTPLLDDGFADIRGTKKRRLLFSYLELMIREADF